MKRILALIEAPQHVCYRYRIRPFEPYLRAAGWTLDVQPVGRGILARISQARSARDYDAVLLQRRLLPGWQLRLLRRCARRLAFDFDDAVLYRDSYDARGPECRKRAQRFRRTVTWADAVIAGNAFLAECATRSARPNHVSVVPTCVEAHKYCSRQSRTEDPSDDGTELVWIGSSSTLQGIEQTTALWNRIGREVPGVRLKLISDRFVQFAAMPTREYRWRLASEFEDLRHSHIGVSWIPDDLWSRGKCGLKLLQYRAAGLPVVTNPVGVHTEIVRHDIDGYLVTTDDDWIEAIRRLAEAPALAQEMGRRARQDVQSRYVPERWAAEWVRAVTGERVIPRPHLQVNVPATTTTTECSGEAVPC